MRPEPVKKDTPELTRETVEVSLLRRTFSPRTIATLLAGGAVILLASWWRSRGVPTATPLSLIHLFVFVAVLTVVALQRPVRLEHRTLVLLLLVGFPIAAGTLMLGPIGSGYESLMIWGVVATIALGRAGALLTTAIVCVLFPLSALFQVYDLVSLDATDYEKPEAWIFRITTGVVFSVAAVYVVLRVRSDLREAFERLAKAAQDYAALERRVGESKKSHALEGMAAGLAHDFGNTMMAARARLERLQRGLGEGSVESDLSRDVMSSIEQASELIEGLRFYGGTTREMPAQVVDLAAVTVGTIGTASHEAGKGDRVELIAPRGRHFVRGVPTNFYRLVLNLVTNAREAVAGRLDGRIRVSVGLEGDEEGDRSHGGRRVCLCVEDNGAGIEPDIMDRIFDPYFTTKKREGGGLGLAIVHRIVEELCGEITVRSELGQGTRFRVLLPAAPGPMAEADSPPDDHGKGSRILVVEDTPEIAEWIADTLSEAGFDVDVAEDPEDALRRLATSSTRYDMACVDMSLPTMSGIEFAFRVRAEQRSFPLLLMSGDVGTFSGATGSGLPSNTVLLAKPCSPPMLLSRVRETLSAAPKAEVDPRGKNLEEPGPESPLLEARSHQRGNGHGATPSSSAGGSESSGLHAPTVADELRYKNAALHACPDGIALLKEGIYFYANPSHAVMYGYENADELIGQSWTLLYDASEASRIHDVALTEVERSGRWKGEVVGKRRDGSLFDLRVEFTRVGRDVLICTSADISERNEFRSSLAQVASRLQMAMATVEAGTWDWDSETQKVQLDERCRSLLRIPPGVDLGVAELFDLLDEESRRAVRERIMKPLQAGVTQRLRCNGVRYDGTAATWSVSVTTDHSDTLHRTRVSGLIVEGDVRRTVGHLRAELISVLGHELNTPLTSLRGFLELLRSPSITELKRARYFDVLHREVLRLGQLAYNVGQLQRLDEESKSTASDPVTLAGVLERANRTAAQITGSPDRIRTTLADDLPLVEGGWAALHCIFANILINAYKFSDPDTYVRVDAQRTKEWVAVKISDEGIGAEEAETVLAFEPFFHGPRAERFGRAGIGLGLAIVGSVVEQIGGSVAFSSIPDVGTTVTVTLRPNDPVIE